MDLKPYLDRLPKKPKRIDGVALSPKDGRAIGNVAHFYYDFDGLLVDLGVRLVELRLALEAAGLQVSQVNTTFAGLAPHMDIPGVWGGTVRLTVVAALGNEEAPA